MNTRTRPLATLGAGLTAALLLAACGQSEDAATPAASTTPEPAATSAESASLKPRLVLTYDGGIQVLDATTLEPVADLELDGFNRVNPAGDGRHVMVSTAGGFQVLDAGTWEQAHGDHAHYFVAEPRLTDLVYDAETPGHVVVHEGRTALFDDGTGQVTIVDSADIADPDTERRAFTTPQAHHGVAVELSDGSVVVSEGDEDTRTGIRLLAADGAQTAADDQCPGVHGEAVAADETVVIGCEDGALIVAGGQITKVTSPDAYGRIGNQAGSEDSPIVLGDYKSDPDADLERPTRVSLIDTRTAELTLVDLPSSYTFRSLARGDDGEALVLGTDGNLHVIDPETGTLVRSMPVLDAWEEPEDWQQPRPAIQVHEGTAYIADPAHDRLLAVDVLTGEVWNTADLTVTPNELTVATGEAASHEAHDEHADEHEDHADEHDDHDHDEHEDH
ncbi:zinc metallochaperone AztD [Cellulomonas denverensis]|uniref:PQQ-like beta-propeller repeat protein n=1 Tax=Cellulomonas denverensis TaxID=264297 RepID=A0A7X6KRU3_9CELL|nr:zinc metallochaperone AztD [Cellulomonas denverensis]NKY21059.1 PQQ-like beta-propeller repeat protein [Cellulomonas denverensis]GIG26006.1 hypothetical protein Cde04nite_22500 [Cellulomonas denverensis]